MTNPSQLAKEFAQSATPEFQRIVSRLVHVICSSSVKLDAAVKWRQLTFAKEGDFHHWICGISLNKKSVSLLFHYGSLLDESTGAFATAGESRFLRKIEYKVLQDVNETILVDLLNQAIEKHQYFKENWQRLQAQGRWTAQ